MFSKFNNKEVVRGPEPRRRGLRVGVGEPGSRVNLQIPRGSSRGVVLTMEQASSWQMCVGLSESGYLLFSLDSQSLTFN